MSQIYIITGVLGLISLLVCYIFIRQTIVKKKKEKERLQRALHKRAKFLIQMVEAFPKDFLPSELSIFLLRITVDTFEQLTLLMPDEDQYVNRFTLYTQKMEAVIKASNGSDKTETIINDASQIEEHRQSLNQLGRFIQSWAQRGNLAQKQYSHFKSQIKQLIVQLMVDNYMISASQSEVTGKYKLGIHYYTLAKNMIVEEKLEAIKRNQLALIEEKILELQATLDSEIQKRAQEAVAENTTEVENSNQWSNADEDDDWKKKNIYD